MDYVRLSWEYDFPPEIETALENDYVANQNLYNEAALKRVAALLLIAPGASPQCAVGAVKNWPQDLQATVKPTM